MSAINSQTVDLVKRLDYALSFGTTRRETLTNLLRECKELLSVLSGPADEAARYRWLTKMWPLEITRLVHNHHASGPISSDIHDAIKAAMDDEQSAIDRSERG